MPRFSFVSRLFTLLAVHFVLVLPAPASQKDATGEGHFLKNVRQLTYEGKRSGEGYFSKDGKALIFQSERVPGNPFFQIYILNLETGDSHRVSPGKGKTTCAFFRNTDEVLFGSTHLDPQVDRRQQEEYQARTAGKKRRYSWDYDVHMDIFSARWDGSGLKRLTEAYGYDAEGSYSHDGKKIVFCSLREAYAGELSAEDRKRLEIDPSYFGEIYLMNADGSHQARLTNWPGYDGGPFFTPDGERIVWRHFEENGAIADVYTMKLDGSDVRRITDFKAMSWAPYFHPSGEYLLFAANKLGFSNFELYLVDANGEREPVRVTFTDGFDGLPAFSLDGNKVCWTSIRTGNKKSQLFLADWDHEAALAQLSTAPRRGTAEPGLESFASEKTNSAAASTGDKSTLSPEIASKDFKSIVSYLASDELEGRMSGSKGTRLAAQYIAARFQAAGLQPLGDNGTYLQEFEFTAGVRLREGQNQMTITDADGTTSLRLDRDFRPLAFSTEDEIEGEVVFAGYGLAVPGEGGAGANSYAGLDVKDKIVLVLRYVPEAVEMERRQVLNRYAALRYKAMIAREHGAIGLLAVTGPNSPNAGKLIPLSYDNSSANSGIVALSISGEVAQTLFARAGKTLADVQTELDRENPHYEGRFQLPGVSIRIRTGIARIKKRDDNVVGMLPATGKKTAEAIIIGAHYDHIGYGETGSLARKGEEGQIHNGADDNASGTSTVLELAAALADAQKHQPDAFKRDLIFALWSGEELGIIGSSAFTDTPPVALKNVAAYLNFDMVGRLRENKLILQGVGSSPLWRRLVEKRNVVAGFSLVIQDDPYQPTDITAFYPKGVPVLSFFTGSHEDYNRPTDDAETLNYPGLERIAKFAMALILDLARDDQRPEYVKVERVKSRAGNRETMRAYLGTIPDYVGEGTGGVKLSGVSAGGPADKAGLKGGDIIVEFAGKEITNIYDYTYALDAVKIGQPVKIVVLREHEKVPLVIVPEARE
ncbi:MAG: M28 family peptidase [bacterium]